VTPAPTALAATFGMNSRFDAGLYRWVTSTAQHAPQPVNDTIKFFSDYGLGLFAVLMLIALWRSRPLGPVHTVQALAVPLTVVVAFFANDAIKSLFDEQRPCRTLHTVTVEACPALGDYSFPSNHTVVAAATAAALLLIDRRTGLVAVPLAVLLGASRVWIGVHYPHDVLAGLLVGALFGVLLTLLVRRFAPRAEGVGLLNGRLLSSRPSPSSTVPAAPEPDGRGIRRV
jgi:membrane-associated phospholipid phosphatase